MIIISNFKILVNQSKFKWEYGVYNNSATMEDKLKYNKKRDFTKGIRYGLTL